MVTRTMFNMCDREYAEYVKEQPKLYECGLCDKKVIAKELIYSEFHERSLCGECTDRFESGY